VWHGVLLVFGAPCQLPLLAGREHGRTIPLAAIGRLEIPQRSSFLRTGFSVAIRVKCADCPGHSVCDPQIDPAVSQKYEKTRGNVPWIDAAS